jgi:hypothetical protein
LERGFNVPFLIVLGIIGIAAFLILGGNLPIAPTTQVQVIAKAIAKAEGFYVQGSISQRAHNPGDLELGDIGYGTISLKTIYPSDGQGWNALYRQVERFLGILPSSMYNSNMSIAEIASHYVGDSGASDWARNVADALGVDVDTPIGEVTA